MMQRPRENSLYPNLNYVPHTGCDDELVKWRYKHDVDLSQDIVPPNERSNTYPEATPNSETLNNNSEIQMDIIHAQYDFVLTFLQDRKYGYSCLRCGRVSFPVWF
jgi:hypothetical protein